MSFKVSTGLRNYLLATGSFKAAMDNGFLKIYSGTEPASAGAALGSAVLLVTISVDAGGGGLSFEASASSGILSKATAETWQGTTAQSGEASFFRFVTAGDAGDADDTAFRVQGSVGVVGSDLNLSAVNLVAPAVQTINHFNVALPTL
jgi:hypothetical protein